MSSSNEDELRKVWNLIDSHFDTALLTDADIEKIDEEKKNGFYMACGVCGIERDRVDELYEKCVAQLQAELKEEK